MSTHPPPKLYSHTLPWPVNWTALFGADRPLVLEIGFGYGHFLEHLWRSYPDHNIIGVEINNDCMDRAERAIARKGMHNVRVIYSRAETALHHLFAPETIEQVYINFPDPWFKARHAGRRLMQRDTLDALVSRLRPQGELYLATDILAYAEMSHALLAETPGLVNQLPTPWANAMPGRIVTKYERKAQEAGRACHYFAYRRSTQPAPFVPIIQEFTMPHVVLRSPQPFDAALTAFQSSEQQIGEVHIRFMYLYRGDQTLLFEVYIDEPTIEQRIGILLVAHREDPDLYTLKLSTLGSPRPTEGVHRAVALLGQWLLSLNPAAVVIQNKVRALP